MKKTSLFVFLLMQSALLFSQSEGQSALYNLEKGLALQGYDPVAYFTDKKPVKGSKAISVSHEGVTYWFKTEANKMLFQQSPTQYMPQYGGWCAYALGAKGEKVGIDPETFKIIDGKLYLFYNAFFTNTLEYWNKDEKGLKPKADAAWGSWIKKGN